MPAFAIYTADQTILMPVDAEREPTTASGQWLADPSDPSAVVHRAEPDDAGDIGLPACPCVLIEGACLGVPVVRTIRPRAGFSIEWDAPHRCSCYGGSDTPAARGVRYASPHSYSGTEVRCDPPPPEPDTIDSLVGGTIFTSGSGSSAEDGCGNEVGRNVYDAWGDASSLVSHLDSSGRSEAFELCESGAPDVARLFGVDGLLAARRAAGEEQPRDEEEPELGDAIEDYGGEHEDGYDDEEYDPCDHEPDVTYPVLRNGELCAIGHAVNWLGDEAWWAGCEPVRPSNCPTTLDPCGDPSAFRTELTGADAFWVETSGLHAVSVVGDRAHLHRRGREPRPVDASIEGPIVGALYFADATHLEAAMQHDYAAALEEPSAPQSCAETSACPAGQLCDPESHRCHPPCTSDQDCAWRDRCGARCHEDGLCGPAPTGLCDDREFPCDDGFTCRSDGTCIQCRTAADCSELRGCMQGSCRRCTADDQCTPGTCRDGRCLQCQPDIPAGEYGNRCYRAIRAGDHTAAEPLCHCGLIASPSPRVLGALHYNLGLIYEQRGDAAMARLHYERSLEARENETVRRRLDALQR